MQESTQTTTNLDQKIIDFHMYALPLAPERMYYVPDFITPDEEASLLSRVYVAPKPRWTCLSNRRLQNWGGLPHPKGMAAEALPDWLERLIDRLLPLGVFSARPNHVLVNEYLPGQGIMPHHDGPLYEPVVATVSLGSHTLLDLYAPLSAEAGVSADLAARYVGSALLEPRSLVVLTGLAYTHFMHGIAERQRDGIAAGVDGDGRSSAVPCRLFNAARSGDPTEAELERGTRVSLTIRRVPKVAVGLSRLLLKK